MTKKVVLSGPVLCFFVHGRHAGAFTFRPHYFVLLLPASAVLAGAALDVLIDMTKGMRRGVVRYGVPAGVVASVLASSVYAQRAFLFEMSPYQVSRKIYLQNPFSGVPGHRRLHPAAYPTGRPDRGARIGAADLFLCAKAIGIELHLHVSAPGNAPVRPRYAKGDEYGGSSRRSRSSWSLSISQPRGCFREGSPPARFLTGRRDTCPVTGRWAGAKSPRTSPGFFFYWDSEVKQPPKSPKWIGIYQRIPDRSPDS